MRSRLILEQLEARDLLSFLPPVNYDVGNSPADIQTGDFNGDSIPDLVVANAGSNTVSVLLGKGDGTFGPSVSYAVGKSPRALALGDFTHHGRLDLAVANYDDATVSVLLGNGDGTFQSAQTYGLGLAAQSGSIAVGDFRNDGNLDIVVANRGFGTISVLLGNGDGTFQPAKYFFAFAQQQSLGVTDFNHDGKLDLAVTAGGALYMMPGNGDGTFQVPASAVATGSAQSLTLGDFNHDGNPDIAVTDAPGNSVIVFLGDGHGLFSNGGTYDVGSPPGYLVAADFVGDNNLDIVTANRNTNDVSLLRGNGDGTFQAAISYNSGGAGAAALAVGDFNGDGAPDLALANAGSNSISVLLNRPEATSLTMTAPGSVSAGTPFTISLNALGFNRTVTTYTGTVHFTSSDPRAILPADYTFTADDEGIHTFASGVTLLSAGTQTITASDKASGLLDTVTVTVTLPPDHFSISAPAAVVAGSPFAFTVTALSGQNQIAQDYTGTVHFTDSDSYPGLVPSDYTFTADDKGVHTFSGAVLYRVGAQTITIQDGSITGNATIAVATAPANHFLVAAPSSTIAGGPFDFTVTALDPYGNVDTGYRGTVILASSDRSPQLSDYAFTLADQGRHSFTISLFTAGLQSVLIRDAGNTLVAGTAMVTVQAAAADHFVLVAPPTTVPGVPVSLIVAALDPFGNVDTNYHGTVHITTSDTAPGVLLPADYTFTSDDAGIHAFAGGCILITPGLQVLIATDTASSITGSVTIMVS